MKKLIIRVSIVLVVLVIAALAVVFFSLNSIVKRGVETVGPKLTQTPVTLGAANISPFSGSGQLTKLVVGNPEGYKSTSAIQVGDMKMVVKIGSVFSDVIVVDEINIQSPEFTLEGMLTGNNLSKILDNLKSAGGDEKKSKVKPESTKAPKKIIVKKFVLNDAKVHIALNIPAVGEKTANLTLPPIQLLDIGEKSNGVTAAELFQQIMVPVYDAIIKMAEEALRSGLKDVTKGATEQLNKAVPGMSNLPGVSNLFRR